MKTMQQWQMTTLGERGLALAKVAVPTQGPGEVLVKISAVALNYRDTLMIDTGMGLDIPLPFVPASDMAGEVVAIGEGVTRVAVGDHVINTFWEGWIDGDVPPGSLAVFGGTRQGFLREYAVVGQDWLVKAPCSLDDVSAATLTCAGLTAWFALHEAGRPLRAGQTVVMQGTGGVALFGAQLALAYGAKAIVTSSSEAKLARAAALGVTHGVLRRNGRWADDVLHLTEGRGADLVFELAGGDMAQTMAALATGGKVAVIGMLDEDTMRLPMYPTYGKRAQIQGIGVGHRRALEDLVAAVDRHAISPAVDAVYDFADLPQALAHLRRGAFGKVVVRVGVAA